MRTVALAAVALAFAPMASAHIVGHAKDSTVRATLAHQERAYSHARYVCVRGTGEIRRWHCAASVWIRRELAETRAALAPPVSSPVAAISAVFGPYAGQALAVARCESGLSVNAQNGQYLGLFQMGSYARSTYGHAGDAYGQARAAFAYFRASGYSWGPWSCKP